MRPWPYLGPRRVVRATGGGCGGQATHHLGEATHAVREHERGARDAGRGCHPEQYVADWGGDFLNIFFPSLRENSKNPFVVGHVSAEFMQCGRWNEAGVIVGSEYIFSSSAMV